MSPRTVVALVAASALLALLPATARADGLPAVGIDARPLSLPGGHIAYLTKSAKQSTLVIARAPDRRVLLQRHIDGRFSLPAVAYDGSPSGLSANGRKLVLISPRMRYPRTRTTFAVLDANTLRVRRHIGLKGDFSFDAISPDGRFMYLVKYDPHSFGEYDVRAYDLRAGRLLRKPIVDPSEPDEEMYGLPMTRTSSPDGRWAYTLYDSRKHPFVHALDTSGRTAVCIDLDNLNQVWGATLELRGPNLEVVGRGGRLLATIDRRSHELTQQIAAPARRSSTGAAAKARAASAASATPTEDAGTSWLPLVLPTAALLLLAAAGRRLMLKRRRAAPISGAWEQSSDQHAPTG